MIIFGLTTIFFDTVISGFTILFIIIVILSYYVNIFTIISINLMLMVFLDNIQILFFFFKVIKISYVYITIYYYNNKQYNEIIFTKYTTIS